MVVIVSDSNINEGKETVKERDDRTVQVVFEVRHFWFDSWKFFCHTKLYI